MKIILSPAKKMIVDTDNLAPVELPVYIDKTAEVLNWMKSKSKEELKAIWKCNDKIAEQNFNRLENMDLYNRLTPAVLAYDGIAFQMIPTTILCSRCWATGLSEITSRKKLSAGHGNIW